MKKIAFYCSALALISLSACSKDDDDVPTPVTTPETPTDGTLNLSISGLEDLGSNYQYEGWVIVNGAPVSTGTFTVDVMGSMSHTSFTVAQSDLDNATKFVLSIEPIPDTDAGPADTKILAGDFSGSSATLSTSVAPAVGDFSDAAGTLFLRTPTDETGTDNGNNENGVWFGIPGMPPTNGFTLPTLPAGWAYEGWVIGDAGPISTGTFTSFTSEDSGNPFSGTQNNAGPPVPGEDFFLNAPAGETFPLDVRGRRVVISVEPIPDNSTAPFLLKPLLVDLSSTAALAPTTHNFTKNLGSLPTGTATK